MVVYRWKEQDTYIEWIEASCGVDTMQRMRDSETKLQQQLQESVKRENILNMKLATKHQEMQDLLVGNTTISGCNIHTIFIHNSYYHSHGGVTVSYVCYIAHLVIANGLHNTCLT